MNREELKERIDSIVFPFTDGTTSQHIVLIAEQYAQSQTSELQKEIDRLKAENEEALAALCCMYNQYCNGPGGHVFMSAGEDTLEILEKHKLFNDESGDGQGRFTEKAIELIGWNPNS